MVQVVKPCSVPCCQRPRPADLRASFTPGRGARQVKVPACPWCVLGRTVESRELVAFHGRRRVRDEARRRLEAWMTSHGYDPLVPPPVGSGRLEGKPSGVVVDVDLDVDRTPEDALRDGLIEPRARGYGATEKGRAAIQQLRRRVPRPGSHTIHRRVGLGKATVVAIIQQLEASQ